MHYNELRGNIRPAQMQSCEHDVKRVPEAISVFTNPFSSIVEDTELYYLSSSVPVKPDIAKVLLDAQDIGWKAMEDFIDSHLVEKSVGFQILIKSNKLKTCDLRGQKETDQFTKRYQPDES